MAKKNIRVLVVDDTVLYRKILTHVLSCLPGVEVVAAVANGQLALQSIATLKPDVMTLDFEMPVLGGMATLELLKQQSHDIAVVMVSAHTLAGAQVTMQALELGAFDFIAKPDGLNYQENCNELEKQLKPVMLSIAAKRLLNRPSSKPHSVPSSLRPPAPHHRRQDVKYSPCPTAQYQQASVKAADLWARSGGVQIIAIGVSTGGPNALAEIIPKLPGDLRVPVVLVQHMPPVFTKALAESLNAKSQLTVVEAEHGEPLHPGTVYIAPGGQHMCLRKQGAIVNVELTMDPPENHCRPAADYLFRSVAEIYTNTLGVILTGMGSDGTKGLQIMKARGTQVIAQDQRTCAAYGMPMEAVRAGVVDIEMPLNQIAAEILRRVK